MRAKGEGYETDGRQQGREGVWPPLGEDGGEGPRGVRKGEGSEM